MAEFEIDVNLNAEGAKESLGILEKINDRLKDIKNNLEKATTAEEVEKWSKELAKAEGELKDFNKQVEIIGRDTNIGKMSVLIGSLGNNIRRLDFSAAKKDLKEMIVLTNTMSLSLKNMNTEQATKGLSNLAGGFKQAGSAALRFGQALLANPIGAFVAIVLAIVAAIGLLLKGFGLLDPLMKKIVAVFDFLVKGAKALTDALNLTNFAYDEFGEKSVAAMTAAKEAHEQYRQELEDYVEPRRIALENELALLEASGASEEEIYAKRKEIAVFESGFAAQRLSMERNNLRETQKRLVEIAKETALTAANKDTFLDLKTVTGEYTTVFLTGTQSQVDAITKKLKLDDKQIERIKLIRDEYLKSIRDFKSAQAEQQTAVAQPGIVDAGEEQRRAEEAKRRAEEAIRIQKEIQDRIRATEEEGARAARATREQDFKNASALLDQEIKIAAEAVKAKKALDQSYYKEEEALREARAKKIELERDNDKKAALEDLNNLRALQKKQRDIILDPKTTAAEKKAAEKTLKELNTQYTSFANGIRILFVQATDEARKVREKLTDEELQTLKELEAEYEKSYKTDLELFLETYNKKDEILKEYLDRGILSQENYAKYSRKLDRDTALGASKFYEADFRVFEKNINEKTFLSGRRIKASKKELESLAEDFSLIQERADEAAMQFLSSNLVVFFQANGQSYKEAVNSVKKLTEEEKIALAKQKGFYQVYQAEKLKILTEGGVRAGKIQAAEATIELAQINKNFNKISSSIKKNLKRYEKEYKEARERLRKYENTTINDQPALTEEEKADLKKKVREYEDTEKALLSIQEYYYRHRRILIAKGAQEEADVFERIKQKRLSDVQEVIGLMAGLNDTLAGFSEVRANREYNALVRTKELESEAIQQRLYDLEAAGQQETSLYEGLTNQKMAIDRKAVEERNKLEAAAFKRNQAFAVANAIIMGAQGIVAAYASMPSSPTLTEIVLKTSQAALVATTTAMQIAKIKSTKFTPASLPAGSSPSSAGGGGGGGGGGTQPSFTFFGNQFGGNELGDPERPGSGERMGDITVDVKISESEITSTQRRVVRQSNASQL